MRIILITLFLANVGYLSVQGQIIDEITTSGGTLSNSSNTIDFNVGNLLIGDFSNNQQTVRHGVLSTHLKVIPQTLSEIADLVVSVYPNPVLSILSVDHRKALPIGTSIEVRDLNGALVSNHTIEINTSTSEVDMSKVANGTYLLLVKTGSGLSNTYRIIKQ